MLKVEDEMNFTNVKASPTKENATESLIAGVVFWGRSYTFV